MLVCRTQRPFVGAHADHKSELVRFSRVQSREMASRPWESRAPALKPWGYYAIAAVLLGLLVLGWG